MARFRVETELLASAEACFELSLSVDAHTASMKASGERAVAGVMSGTMTLGDTVTWQARHFGIPFRMTSAITLYDHPTRFVDEQLRGPFRRWWHEHTFIPQEHARTLMIDVVDYDPPFGPVGAVVDQAFLGRYMRHLIRSRNTWLKRTLEHA
jgi:ligand-binding SRPBCC domain-containing protein